MALKKSLYKNNMLFYFTLLFFALIFFACTLFFKTHFYPGTVINGVDVSFHSVREADLKLAKKASVYSLTLIERKNLKEQINGSEINLRFDTEAGCLPQKNKQNKVLWFLSFLNKETRYFGNAFIYDENLLKDRYQKLTCVDSSKAVLPRNASLNYQEGGYVIVREQYGNKASDTILYPYIQFALRNGLSLLNLEKINSYVNPSIIAGSKKINYTKNILGKYIATEITYTYNGGRQTVDRNLIKDWILLDEDLNISFDQEKMRVYVKTLAEHYNTFGKVRDFITSSGARIKVGGGDYGWLVDVNGEVNELIDAIKKGDIILKEPKYLLKGSFSLLNDIGYTYVEIDLSKQHLWYYESGFLVVHGNIVSGKDKPGYKTPEGIYSLKYKEENAVLRGENYRANVSYWLPFNNNIGIHDASWRSHFGGDIYLTRGSHGCINAPYYLAKTLFEHIDAGTPVVCYY